MGPRRQVVALGAGEVDVGKGGAQAAGAEGGLVYQFIKKT